ncbi:hypothetical protein ACQPVP_15345 [Clostridium nigeriense]|uniref:hypothetical protein n=1 Tax=Clostridium nigeriense TaxID=1805470 RepID=UPI003D3506A0
MFKFTYEECKATFNKIYKSGKAPLNQSYYCSRFTEIHNIIPSKHKEIIEHYKRFVKEINLRGDNNE